MEVTKLERVTTELLVEMAPGASKRFSAPTELSVDSARVLVSRVGRIKKRKYSVTRDSMDSIMVTRTL